MAKIYHTGSLEYTAGEYKISEIVLDRAIITLLSRLEDYDFTTCTTITYDFRESRNYVKKRAFLPAPVICYYQYQIYFQEFDVKMEAHISASKINGKYQDLDCNLVCDLPPIGQEWTSEHYSLVLSEYENGNIELPDIMIKVCEAKNK